MRQDKPAADAAARAAAFPTIAEALVRFDAIPGVNLRRRREARAALNTVARRLYGLPPEVVRLDPAEFGPRVKSASAAACGLKERSWSTYKTAIGSVLQCLDLIEPSRSKAMLPPAWKALFDGAPDRQGSVRLLSFFRFCAAAGIAPEQGEVLNNMLAEFGTALRTRRLTRNPSDTLHKIAQSWNSARRKIPGWPDVTLRAPAAPEDYTRPFRDFPQGVRDDLARYEAAVRKDKRDTLFLEEGSHGHLREPSFRRYETGIRMAFGALLATGMPIGSIHSLDILIQPDIFKRIVDFHWLRAGRKATYNTNTVAVAVVSFARTLLREGSEELRELRRIAAHARPKKQTRMTRTNEERLAQFDDPVKLACLLHLPEQLFKVAEEQKIRMPHRPQIAAWTASVAVAVAIELRFPVRSLNLARLRMGHDLIRLDGGKHWSHFMLDPEDVKNEEPLRWPVAADTSRCIDRYLRDFRPALTPGASQYLFPSRDNQGEPRSEIGFSNAISEAIYKHVGADMNLHLFRAFAGSLILTDNPGALDDLRLLLGQTTWDTAMRHYRSHQPQRAAERLDRLLDRRMAETAPLARAAFGKRKSKPRAEGPRPGNGGGR